MEVICEKYNVCRGCECIYKKFHYWNKLKPTENNYCYHLEKYINLCTSKVIRKKKLEKINESSL